ncbi:hypothetical protein GGF31_000224 [Allomyces arbusculus]|nr:hypothetical protein GGF31_000224 [Allomyces arbusculus]
MNSAGSSKPATPTRGFAAHTPMRRPAHRHGDAVAIDLDFEFDAPKFVDLREIADDERDAGRRIVPETPSVTKYFAAHCDSPAQVFTEIDSSADEDELGDLLANMDADPVLLTPFAAAHRTSGRPVTARKVSRAVEPVDLAPIISSVPSTPRALADMSVPETPNDTPTRPRNRKPRAGADRAAQANGKTQGPEPGSVAAGKLDTPSRRSSRRKSVIMFYPTEPASSAAARPSTPPRATAVLDMEFSPLTTAPPTPFEESTRRTSAASLVDSSPLTMAPSMSIKKSPRRASAAPLMDFSPLTTAPPTPLGESSRRASAASSAGWEDEREDEHDDEEHATNGDVPNFFGPNTVPMTPVQRVASTEHIVYLSSKKMAADVAKTPTLRRILKQHKSPLRIVASPIKKKRTVGLKVLKPFRAALLSTAASAPAAGSPFVPLAQRVQQFLRTPKRKFKPLMPRLLAAAPPPPPATAHRPKITHPKSPRLLTKLRAKPTYVMSAEEREIQMMQNIKPFKARPANQKILHADGPLGVPPLKHLAKTTPMSPAITKPKPRPVSPPPQRPAIGAAKPSKTGTTKPAPFTLRTEARSRAHNAAVAANLVSGPKRGRDSEEATAGVQVEKTQGRGSKRSRRG